MTEDPQQNESTETVNENSNTQQIDLNLLKREVDALQIEILGIKIP